VLDCRRPIPREHGLLQKGPWHPAAAGSSSPPGRAEALPGQFQDQRHHLLDAKVGGIQHHGVGRRLERGQGAGLIPLVPGAYVMKKGVKVSS